jgi:hypothetical protein
MEINNKNFVDAPIPVLSKDVICAMTKTMDNDEVQYVSDVKCIEDECCKNEECCKCGFDSEELAENVVYVCKIMAFCDKLRVLHWAATNMSYHNALDDFIEVVEDYKDGIAENLQGLMNCQFCPEDFTQINLPVDNNPLGVANELKVCLNNFMDRHAEDVAYEGCRNLTSQMLEDVYKYIYIFRLCKD